MTDTNESEKRDFKGNLIPKEVWVTHHGMGGYDRPVLVSVNDAPWADDYDAPITKWASNTKYVPADLLADMTRQRDEARDLISVRNAASVLLMALDSPPDSHESVKVWGIAAKALGLGGWRKIRDFLRALAEGAKP